MSRIIDAMQETAKDFKMDSIIIKEIEVLNLSEIKLLWLVHNHGIDYILT